MRMNYGFGRALAVFNALAFSFILLLFLFFFFNLKLLFLFAVCCECFLCRSFLANAKTTNRKMRKGKDND